MREGGPSGLDPSLFDGPAGPFPRQPSRSRIAIFVILYLLVVPFATMASEGLAAWVWSHIPDLLGSEPPPDAFPVPGLEGLVGGDQGLFALRGLTGFVTIALATALFQRGLWQGRRGLAGLGLRGGRAGVEFLLGLVLGAGVMLLVYLILWAAGWATWPTPAPSGVAPRGWAVLLLAAGFVLLAAQEELIARGFLLQSLAAGWGFPAAAVLQAVLFGLAHLANPYAGLASTVGIFAAGLLFAAAYARTGRLWLPSGIHAGWNLMEGPVLGLPVSGLKTARFLETQLEGPVAVTGGSFGPEAGWVAVGILLLATLWLARARRSSRPEP